MFTPKRLLFALTLFVGLKQADAQFVQASKDELIALTSDWKGERFPDGRPKVPDDIIRRMKAVTIEEAWATISSAGFRYQIAEGWGEIINRDSVLVGRAFTTTFMPGRPDVWKAIDSMGKKEGRRAQNVWAVEQLSKGDVYVADQFGAKRNGPTIGDRVGTAIYTRTGNGIVYDGALRDVEGLKEMGGFTSFFSSYDPSYHNPGGGQNRDLTTMIVGINKPTRIRTVTVMPGDVVLGKMGVVIFIPPQLAERVVTSSELVRLEDMFGQLRIREGKYTAGQIDARWADNIQKDFTQWLKDNVNKLPVGREQVQEIIRQRESTSQQTNSY
ncbi:Regulator of RNase E activity RraA [Cnuella takakiae]|uniref:Regulator of RNase E activity RraA n=1 Tax=Cnuella takakiae TaxID=1302690 RepID=A0A1M4YXV1_9BACT|nr:dimethylmenaquinone methyltransferase [Cnuella takakiae]OLY94390.1 dimethylmenaquinone methyltransferase [Cnuella takakiae]SHF10623.1 Regulator of RNase E activity RraA [Cnuella takakiae]